MKSNIFTIVLIGFVIMLCIKMYHDSEMFQLRCVISGVDGNEYCVRNRSKVNEAADLLAQTTNKCTKLVQMMGKKKPKLRLSAVLLYPSLNPFPDITGKGLYNTFVYSARNHNAVK